MVKVFASLIAFVAASSTALAQQPAPIPDISKLTPDQVKARDKFENEIAQAIVRARQGAGLRNINRIQDKKLRRLTCTFAVHNDALGFERDLGFPSRFPLVRLVASPDEFGKTYQEWLESGGGKDWTSGPKVARFAVGAWPAQERGKYWVDFEYHPNSLAEWQTILLPTLCFTRMTGRNRLPSHARK